MRTHKNLHFQTPSFPLLPIPLLLSSLSPSPDDLLLGCFSSASASDSGIDVSCQLDTLPVGDAFSKFLSTVLPQPIEVRSVDSAAHDLAPGAGSANIGVQVAEEKDNIATGAKDVNWIDIVQFEVPELGQFLEGSCELERNRTEIFSEVSVCDDNLEMGYIAESDLHLHEVQRSVYSVEDVPPIYSMDAQINISEDNDIPLRKDHSDAMFPQLELEEITRGAFSVISMEDELQLYIARMGSLDTGKYDEVNWQDLFCSMEIEKISDHISSKLFLEPLVAHQNLFLETDHDFGIELSCRGEETGFHFGMFLADSDVLFELLPFEEFEMLDPGYLGISDAFTIAQVIPAPEKFDKSSLKGMNFKSFDELIVCHEISMVDHNFKLFPVPILPDDEKVKSLHAAITVLLDGLESLPVSASDEIYLDWDLLGRDKGNLDIHATTGRMYSDVGILRIDYDIQSAEDSGLLLDFILSDNIWNEIITENKMNMPSGGNTTTVTKPLPAVSVDEISNTDHTRAEEGGKKIGARSVSLRAESVPQFNELEFLLNPTKGVTGMQSDVRSEKLDAEFAIPAGTSQDREIPSLCTTRIQMDKWSIKLHVINLPANILIQKFEKSFLAVTEDLHLSRHFSFPIAGGMLSLPEEKLMECLKILCNDKTFSGQLNAVTSAFCELLAIKRMAWCLCSYGIHYLREFIDEVLQKVEFLGSRLGFLIPYIEEAYMLANKEITRLHPSLGLIQKILKISTYQRSKILIVADQNVWWPLKSLLVSMNVAVTEVTSPMHGCFLDASETHKTSQSRRNGEQSDCLLATHEHISPAILLKKFDIILEYGGLNSSSHVTAILPNPAYSLGLHFLKVELDGAAKALCTGVDIPLSSTTLEELLNFVAMVENCKPISMDTIGQTMHCSMPLRVGSMPILSKSKSADLSSCPHTTIIVNTQNFDTEMIISRRSTYQRILALEKDGVQILERDFCLPVDVIISAGTCLAWYSCKNIGKKATAPDEAASCVPHCVDNIAANVLTTLSFTFRSCIMVFEGESNFIATITESSDELYAAAASLGIELQIFYSYSPELTEEIVLNSITYGMKFHKGLFPKLSESESIAESFLMKFPSINPLSSLAILSTGTMLVEFFALSEDCRIRALQKYHVPTESIILLSILSKYGKREESISGMTDCSSSVSSAPNSERSDCKFSFEKRKREINESSFDAVNVDNFYKPTASRLQKTSAEPPLDIEAFYQELRSDDATKINPLMISEPQILWSSSDPNLVADDIPEPTLPSNSRFSGHKKKSAMAFDADIFKGFSDDFMGEVVDFNDETLFGGNFSSGNKAANFFLPKNETDEAPGIKSSRAVRSLSFEPGTHPNFSTLSQMGSDSNLWSSQDDDRRARRDTNDLFDRQKEPVGGKTVKSAALFHKLLNKEKAPYGFEETPLRKSINSKDLEEASPWTKGFLNQVREKMRQHKQYKKSDTPTRLDDYYNTVSKMTKRKSPSTLELFKYKGNTPSKPAKRVRQKQYSKPPPLSKNENDLSMRLQAWTPIDKRATQTLSYAPCGNGGQTKLIWSDRDSESPAKRFRRLG